MVNVTGERIAWCCLLKRGAREKNRNYGILLCAGFLCALLVAGISPVALAQSTARVSGLVHDQTGAVVPGATVVLRDEASGTELRVVTEESGFYSFDPVPPKTYSLTVAKEGFKTYSKTGIEVHPADRLDLSASLDVGAQSERVEVTATAEALVPTDSGAKVDVLTSGQIQNLSTMGRNALELLGLLAGVVDTGFNPSQGSHIDSQGPFLFSVNGLDGGQNDYHIDGARGVETGGLASLYMVPNMDMIQEFSVKTSNVEADQGRSPVNIDVVTKSGGKDFHGTLFYYGRNAALNANDFSNNLAGIPKPASKFNYPGFNLGGPVRIPGTGFNKNRDKLFFFVGMEWQRQLPDPGTQLVTVPTAKMRTGDFSELLNPKFCQTDASGNVTGGRYLNMPCILKDPNDPNGKPLPGNILPASDITNNGQIFLNVFPLPNLVDPAGRRNFAAHPLYPNNPFQTVIKVDYNFSEKTRMFVRLSREAEEQVYPFNLWAGENSGWTSNIPEPGLVVGSNHNRALAVNVVQTLNPTLTNEFQLSAQALYFPNRYRFPEKVSRSALGFNFKGMTFPGTPTVQNDTVPQIIDAWDYFGGNPGAGRWGAGNFASGGVYYKSNEFEFFDNLSKVKSTHILKFGFAVEQSRQTQSNAPVTEGQFVTDATWGLTTGNEFGDILSEHYKAYLQTTRSLAAPVRGTTIEWYSQDSWKVTRRLTLNYGARFTWSQPWQVLHNAFLTFDPKAYDPTRTGDFTNGILLASKGQIGNGGFGAPHPVIQPRLGFAWDVFGTGKSVLRGGFGTYVHRQDSNQVNNIANSPPQAFTSNPSLQFTSLGQIENTNPFGVLGNLSLAVSDVHDTSTPQVYQWSLTWSQSIGFQTVVETSYVGNTTRHLGRSWDINAVPLGAMWLPGTQTLGADTNAQDFRPFNQWGSISLIDHSLTSNYNSLQVTARRNAAKGLTLLGAYTWSKALGTAATPFQDQFDSKRNYGLQAWDRAHNFSLSFIYDLPSPGKRHFSGNWLAKGVLDTWRFSAIAHYTSGPPLSVTTTGISCVNAPGEANPTSLGLCSNFIGDGRTWYGSSALAVLPVVLSNPRSGASSAGVNEHWLNPASITLPPIGQFGTFEQPTYRSPGSNKWDMTVFKEFPIREKLRLQFRLAAFDVFNRAQLLTPQTTAQFFWNLPLGATSVTQGSASLANSESFGVISNKQGHREVELAIKLIF